VTDLLQQQRRAGLEEQRDVRADRERKPGAQHQDGDAHDHRRGLLQVEGEALPGLARDNAAGEQAPDHRQQGDGRDAQRDHRGADGLGHGRDHDQKADQDPEAAVEQGEFHGVEGGLGVALPRGGAFCTGCHGCLP